MQVLLKFASRRYIILHDAIPEAQLDAWRSLARSGDHVWFRDVLDGVLDDDARIQATIPDQLARHLSVSLRRYYKTFFSAAEANDWRSVKTRAGAADCIARREFKSVLADTQLMDVDAIPGTIMIAMENDTFMYEYGWDHRMAFQSHKKMLTLNKGDIILWRGDLIYPPVGYQTNRVCLQAYLDPPTFDRAHNHQPFQVLEFDDTVNHDNMSCFVWNCPFRANGEGYLCKHLNRIHGFCFNQGRRASAM